MRSNKLAWSAVLLVGCIVTMGAMAGSASAALLVYEPFDYPPNAILTGNGGALGTTGTWLSHDTISGDGKTQDWFVHAEGTTSGVGLSGANPSVEPSGMHRWDGTVANLPTAGGYVGLWGADDWNDPDPNSGEPGRNLDASIALDPSVTATFQPGTTTWFSYVAVRGWDRNEETPNLTIGTDPTPNESRAFSLTNNGNGIGTGGGPTRGNRTHIYPMYYKDGTVHNLNAAITGWRQDADTVPADSRMDWQELDADGFFGPPNIVVGKIEWDADTGGEDIISVARFLETDTLSEAAFDALIAAKPNLSSANWAEAANKPNLDQTQFDVLNIAGLKFFVDEIRIGTTFDVVVTGKGNLVWRTDFTGDWDTANWTSDGGTSFTTPAGDEKMVVDSAAGRVNVASDLGGTAAASLDIAENAGGTVDVAAAGTLVVTGDVTVGPSGTLRVDGTLTAAAVTSGGALAGNGTLDGDLVIKDAGVYELELGAGDGLTGTGNLLLPDSPETWTVRLVDAGGAATASDELTLFSFATFGTGGPVDGDVNQDALVNDADLNLLLSAFGETGAGLAADLDGDEDVDEADLEILLGNFGAGNPAGMQIDNVTIDPGATGWNTDDAEVWVRGADVFLTGLNAGAPLAVPEPNSLLLLSLAAFGLIPLLRRKRKN